VQAGVTGLVSTCGSEVGWCTAHTAVLLKVTSTFHREITRAFFALGGLAFPLLLWPLPAAST
jgi:hypothetical protein